MKTFLLGLILGLLAIPVAAYVYFKEGHPPVAVADQPFPMERQFVKTPLHARINKEMPHSAPIEPTAANLEAGARIYSEQCAACHGYYGHLSEFALQMYPRAPQLWQRHKRNNAVGVSDDPVGNVYWKIDNGIRLTGMPAFNKILSPTQMWQVTLLLSHADKPLPANVMDMLRRPAELNAAVAVPAPKNTQNKD